ncbi:hypothetical protein AVDCRST_MAG94-5757, partial [uncultured Leptolyngbya sp.]
SAAARSCGSGLATHTQHLALFESGAFLGWLL